MKTFMVLTVFAIVISCIKSSYRIPDIQSNFYSEVPEFVRRFCDLSLENRKMFRMCLHENGIGISSEFYRNCGQQLKFGQTYEEVNKFVCHSDTKLSSLFYKCFIPALETLNLDNPKVFLVIRKCFSNEENAGFHAKDHIKEVYEF